MAGMEKIQGIAIYKEGVPEATPLIFVHGFPLSHEMWKPQREFFSKSHSVISYDLRGHGQSDVGDGQYTLEHYVDDLFMLMDHLKLECSVVCGLSMGGYIALRAFEREPGRFLGLVLCDTKSEADSDEAKLKRAGAIRHIKKTGMAPFVEEFTKTVLSEKTLQTKPELVHFVKGMMQRNSPLGVCGALLALAARTDTTRVLPKISVPTMILVGQEDKVTPPATAQAMLKSIPQAALHLIPDAGHLSNLENPAAFNGFLDAFLGKI